MALRRVTVPGGGQFGQDLQDSVSRLTRQIDEGLLSSYGTPTKILTSDYRPKIGELARFDMRNGNIEVILPKAKRQRIGNTITIANVSDGTSKMTIRPASGTINGEDFIEIEKAYFLREAGYFGEDANGEDLWILTTVLDGATSSGTTPFWSWNGTDLSQFGSLENGSANSQTASVVSAQGLNWIQIHGNCTGSADFATASCFLPVNVTPPSANYIVVADCVSVLANSIYIEGGVAVRQAAGSGTIGSGYFMGFLLNRGTGTGDTALVKVTSGASSTLHGFTTSEGFADGRGHRIVLAAEGSTHLSAFGANQINYKDSSSPFTSAGRFGIWAGGNNAGTNTYTTHFRNIKAYEWPNDGLIL